MSEDITEQLVMGFNELATNAKLVNCLDKAEQEGMEVKATLGNILIFMGFPDAIRRMNEMYRLPIATFPGAEDEDGVRIRNFQDILEEEVKELGSIKSIIQRQLEDKYTDEECKLDYLTELADVLGDIVVYCFSEALRNGIPLHMVLACIMQSNFSKLGEDGEPIYDERGKFQKGPNYWKPEPLIKELLRCQTQQPRQQ
jgi:predicted HAD superfamily Cof-like phosphohydrolase